MNSTLWLLALVAPTDGGRGGLTMLVVQFGAIIAIFYFLLIRPQGQARKKHAALLANLKKGDEVVTAGGIIGKVRDIKDNRITVESGTSQVVVERARIVQVGTEVSPTANQ
jgi:preprotein translocase subunit YajC